MTAMNYGRTQKDIRWAVAQGLSPLASVLFSASVGATNNTVLVANATLLVQQPAPLFSCLCEKIWPDRKYIPASSLIFRAAQLGCLKTIKQCVFWSITNNANPNYRGTMAVAAHNGHLQIVKQCRIWICADHEIPDYEYVMFAAVNGGQSHIITFCNTWMNAINQTPNYGGIMTVAARRGCIVIVKQCQAWIIANGETPPDYNYIMDIAARNGHIDIVKQCRAWIMANGETPDYTHATALATYGKHTEISALLQKWQHQ